MQRVGSNGLDLNHLLCGLRQARSVVESMEIRYLLDGVLVWHNPVTYSNTYKAILEKEGLPTTPAYLNSGPRPVRKQDLRRPTIHWGAKIPPAQNTVEGEGFEFSEYSRWQRF